MSYKFDIVFCFTVISKDLSKCHIALNFLKWLNSVSEESGEQACNDILMTFILRCNRNWVKYFNSYCLISHSNTMFLLLILAYNFLVIITLAGDCFLHRNHFILM